jgi:hypothetical protein
MSGAVVHGGRGARARVAEEQIARLALDTPTIMEGSHERTDRR